MCVFECDGCGAKAGGEMRLSYARISHPFGWIELPDGKHACSAECNEKIHAGIEAARRFVGDRGDG